MKRFFHPAKWAALPAFVLLAASFVSGAVIFEDDFNDAAASRSKWVNTLEGATTPEGADAAMTVTVESGNAALNNPGPYGGEYVHQFTTKPSTFTISYIFKSKSVSGGSAGVFLCRDEGFNGYLLTVGRHDETQTDMIALFKYAGGVGSTIFYQPSVDLKESDNKLAVSKNGSEFHIYVNDVWQGSVTDNAYSSGDVSLFVSPGVQASFSAFRMTDEFTPGGQRTSFADNFDNGSSKYWQVLASGGTPEIGASGGVLNVKVAPNVGAWMYVDINLAAEFTASVEARHIGGGTATSDFYGIILAGDPPASGGAVPMVYFAITGNRYYAVYNTASGTVSPAISSAIRGSSGAAAVINIDTLTVHKKAGASAYEFLVNGVAVSIDQPVANFKITGVGLYCSPASGNTAGLNIAFDNFSAAPYGHTSISFGRNPQQTVRKNAVIRSANPVFYDLRGRKVYTANAATAGRTRVRAAGVYVSENGRDVLTGAKRKR